MRPPPLCSAFSMGVVFTSLYFAVTYTLNVSKNQSRNVAMAPMFQMKDQCAMEKSNSSHINNISDTIICPAIAAKYPKFLCNRTSTFSYPLLSMVDFVQFLDRKNMTILYAGDSLQEQMFHALLCSVEAQNRSMLEMARRRVKYAASSFLAILPPKCIVTRSQFNTTVLQNDDWFHVAIRDKVTHLVFNTGAWFIPSGIRVHKHKATNEQTRECYKVHLSYFGSPLNRRLRILSQQHGVEMIWRDVSPAGMCSDSGALIESKYTYHYNDFQYYNMVGRNVTTHSLKGMIVPDVFDDSVRHWREHMSLDDTMHWCSFRKASVPSIWNTKLYNLLREKY